MRVLLVASEVFPLSKTGGLADVVAALGRALVAAGDEVRVLMPAYRGCAAAANATPICDLGDPLGVGPTRLLAGALPGSHVRVWLVDCPPLYDRPGGPYLDEHGHDWPDNDLRFGLLSRVAAMLGMCGAMLGWQPDVVHGHDWQAGLACAHLGLWGGKRPATVFTIHNLHFHGLFDGRNVEALGLPRSAFNVRGLEFHGHASFLKAGLFYADRLTTVSPTYAREIQTEEGGEGLHGLLRSRSKDLVGILNGIDDELWDPRLDPNLVRTYGPESLAPKLDNKRALQQEMGLEPDDDAPLVGWVGRLTGQKGMDLLLGALPRMLQADAQLVVVGTGEPTLERAVSAASAQHPGRVAFFRGYDEALSHRVIAGSDILVVPSRFEPCGLTQLYAMRYGTIPVVRRTGGLRDTVPDASGAQGTGFSFDEPTAEALAQAMSRAFAAYRNHRAWRELQYRGMYRPMGWTDAAASYRALYRSLVRGKPAPVPMPGALAVPLAAP